LPRVNAWLLEDDILNCASSYESGAVNGMRGELLEHDKYPRYFEELINNRMIISNKAQEDERLKELWDTYLIPNNIRSLLDTTIQNSGTVQIIVCHESVGEEKKWQPEEIAFAGAITDQVARLLANHEKKRKEQEIRESLKEKETLLMEVHHRVKNNLAVVSGMMQLQAFDTENEELRQKLYDSVMRIKSMATIHELLYQSKHFSKIKLDENIKRLVSTINNTYQTGPEISINYNMEPVVLNMNQAIPASLIINEVVTNSLKHAFDNNENGNIVINLYEQHDLVHLEITDDGIGLDQNLAENLSQKKSLGIKLIDTLSEQIEGNYEYTSPAKGTKFTLTIPKIDLEEINKTKLNWSIK
jgi:two-component sensor histidine kinase